MVRHLYQVLHARLFQHAVQGAVARGTVGAGLTGEVLYQYVAFHVGGIEVCHIAHLVVGDVGIAVGAVHLAHLYAHGQTAVALGAAQGHVDAVGAAGQNVQVGQCHVLCRLRAHLYIHGHVGHGVAANVEYGAVHLVGFAAAVVGGDGYVFHHHVVKGGCIVDGGTHVHGAHSSAIHIHPFALVVGKAAVLDVLTEVGRAELVTAVDLAEIAHIDGLLVACNGVGV